MSAGGSFTEPGSLGRGRGARLGMLLVAELDDTAPVTAPAADDFVDVAPEHLLVLDLELAAHREVVEGLRRLRNRDVETREIAAFVAAVSSRAHQVNGSRRIGEDRTWEWAARAVDPVSTQA